MCKSLIPIDQLPYRFDEVLGVQLAERKCVL